MALFVQRAMSWVLLMFAMTSAPAQTEEGSTDAAAGIVTITIEGADQVPAELAVALTQLASAINALRLNGINLSPDEIKEVDRVLNTLTTLIESIGENATEIDQALRNVEQPLVDLTHRLISRVNETLVSPTLAQANQTVERLEQATRKARNTALTILVVLVVVVLGVLTWAGRQLALFFTAIRRISDGHVIVPRKDWEARVISVETEADAT